MKKLMRRKTRYPKTLKGFSRMLHRALWSEKGFALLENVQGGWTDGECWTLAEAFKRYLQDIDIYCFYDVSGNPMHMAAKLPGRDIFIDGNGVLCQEKIARILIEDEFVEGPVKALLFEPGRCTKTSNGIKLSKQIVSSIICFLEETFGDGANFLRYLRKTLPCRIGLK